MLGGRAITVRAPDLSGADLKGIHLPESLLYRNLRPHF
jgi:hypothetical protein